MGHKTLIRETRNMYGVLVGTPKRTKIFLK